MECPSCHSPVDAAQHFCPVCGAGLSAGGEAVDPLIGQVLSGKYKIVRLIGEGGMGAVYEGEQQLGTTKRRVAIKTLHPHLSRDPKIQARFEREVGTIAELEHPNTIQVYDFGTTSDGLLYIVMEFLQGKSLADLLASKGALSPERADHILQQVCGSLEEAHARGIVHRDLKPDNIVLVERAGQKDFVKVLDFGIAKRAREEDKNEQKLTQQGMVLGTPPYMSPEQFSGTPIDSRSDIYSLAIVAYEMLTGKLPFKADTAWEWATQHMTQRPIPIESLAEGGHVPAAMRLAIERALAKSPDQRFATVQEFYKAFSDKSAPALSGGEFHSASARQKTELGAPLDVAAAFGAAPVPNVGQAGAPLGRPAMGVTPASGNVAFAGPGGIPHAPARERSGGSRAMLLAAAGVIAVASAVAIFFAVRGGSSGEPKDVVFDNGTPGQDNTAAPATSLTPTGPGSGAAAPVDSSGSDIPPLASGGPSRGRPFTPPGAHTGVGPAPSHSGGSGQPPHSEPPPERPQPVPPMPWPVPQPAPRPTPQPAPVPAANYNGPDCEKARTLRALGHPREAQVFAATCAAKGGTP